MGSVVTFSTDLVDSDDTAIIDASSMLLGFKLAVQLQHQYCMFEGVNEEINTAIATSNTGSLLVPVEIFTAIRHLSKLISSWIIVSIDRQFNNLAFDLALWITTTFVEDE